ncbi:response regulator transcription factor [Sediminispirochaeta bajacaliforniensis]|uniref:response regulator transcription factor n=1 Tax=Sediminispirochaeta bajacaliforniensis TaxID=148 RepID=UPI0003693B64|nr:response regulator [Sediminispirochaeta bajacaliforniensis]
MYTVFLADDEKLIREGLAQTIPWDNLGLSLVGTAADGEKAYTEVCKLHPNIVITDIRMPLLNGLDLIKKIRKQDQDCHIVLITGYEEFEYALTAIQVGVSGFIVKPVEVPSLCRILSKIVNNLDIDSTNNDKIIKLHEHVQHADEFASPHVLYKYLTGRLSKEHFFEYMPNHLVSFSYCTLVMLQVDHFDNLTEDMDEKDIFDFTQKLEKVFFDLGMGVLKIIIEEAIGKYLLLFESNNRDELGNFTNLFIRKLRMVKSDLEYTTVCSPSYRGIEHSIEGYDFLCQYADYIFIWGANRDIQDTDVKSVASEKVFRNIDINKILQCISLFDKKGIEQYFIKLEKIIKDDNISSLNIKMIVSMIFSETLQILADINFPIASIIGNPSEEYKKIISCTTLTSMLGALMDFLFKICMVFDTNANINMHSIQLAKLFIDNHFFDPGLTLGKVAEELGFSPNYFSALFKQKVGKSFIDYLTNIRIAHAKKLIISGKFKTYEISKKCGYINPTYFSTIFKRRVGVTPSEYHTDGM